MWDNIFMVIIVLLSDIGLKRTCIIWSHYPNENTISDHFKLFPLCAFWILNESCILRWNCYILKYPKKRLRKDFNETNLLRSGNGNSIKFGRKNSESILHPPISNLVPALETLRTFILSGSRAVSGSGFGLVRTGSRLVMARPDERSRKVDEISGLAAPQTLLGPRSALVGRMIVADVEIGGLNNNSNCYLETLFILRIIDMGFNDTLYKSDLIIQLLITMSENFLHLL